MPPLPSMLKLPLRHPALTACVVLLTFQVVFFIATLGTWMDEGNYLYKSTALIGHGQTLYSEVLPSWYTPLYFVALGSWQEIAGYGLISGRIFSALCFAGALGFLIATQRRLSPSGNSESVVLLALIVICPSVALFHASVTQFAFVNLQVAALIWILFAGPGGLVRWIIAGALTGTIAMTRPNLLLVVPLIPLIFLWVRGWPGRNALIAYLTTWVLVDAIIVAAFGPGAFWNLIRTFPGATGFAEWLGLTRNPAIGSLQGWDLGLKTFDWWETRPETFRGMHLFFLEGVLWPYLPIVAANFLTLARWRQRGYDRSLEAGLALVFLWSSLLHFGATQTFCRTCAYPYSNYSIAFGLLGGAGSAWIALRWIASRGGSVRHWVPWGSVAVLAAYLLAAWLPQGAYRKWHAPEMSTQIRVLARGIETRVPEGTRILPLGDDVRLIEAIHLSGRTADPLLINFQFSQREPIDPTMTFDPELRARIRQRGLWTKELLQFWLREEHEAVIYRENSVPAKANREILDATFTSVPLVPAAAENDPLASYRIALRKTPPEASVAAHSKP